MKNIFSMILMFLALGLTGQRYAQAGPLSILGVAGQYNVFLFGDLDLAQTDVEGRAAAGGNVSLTNFSIGTKVLNEDNIPSLVAGGSAKLTSGSVGCLMSADPACSNEKKGSIVYGVNTNQPDVPPTVGYGNLTKTPGLIDFGAAKSYINWLSAFWKTFAPTVTDTDTTDNFNLVANDPNATQNVFNLKASDIVTTATTGPRFNFMVAPGSVILINVLDDTILLNLRNIGFTFNGLAAERNLGFCPGQPYCHNAGFPFSDILFNFPDEMHTISLDHIAFNGSLIAPMADITFTTDSHIDGNLIANSLTGSGESHAIPFEGTIAAVPEPATLLLFVGGLLGMVARRRRT